MQQKQQKVNDQKHQKIDIKNLKFLQIQYQIDRLLATDNLIRSKQVKDYFSLSEIIAYLVFGDKEKVSTIQEASIKYLTHLIKKNILPIRLQKFQNPEVFAEFQQNPSQNQFVKYFLDLLSLLYQTRIYIFYIEEKQLHSMIFSNQNCDNDIKIFKNPNGKFQILENYCPQKDVKQELQQIQEQKKEEQENEKIDNISDNVNEQIPNKPTILDQQMEQKQQLRQIQQDLIQQQLLEKQLENFSTNLSNTDVQQNQFINNNAQKNIAQNLQSPKNNNILLQQEQQQQFHRKRLHKKSFSETNLHQFLESQSSENKDYNLFQQRNIPQDFMRQFLAFSDSNGDINFNRQQQQRKQSTKILQEQKFKLYTDNIQLQQQQSYIQNTSYKGQNNTFVSQSTIEDGQNFQRNNVQNVYQDSPIFTPNQQQYPNNNNNVKPIQQQNNQQQFFPQQQQKQPQQNISEQLQNIQKQQIQQLKTQQQVMQQQHKQIAQNNELIMQNNILEKQQQQQLNLHKEKQQIQQQQQYIQQIQQEQQGQGNNQEFLQNSFVNRTRQLSEQNNNNKEQQNNYQDKGIKSAICLNLDQQQAAEGEINSNDNSSHNIHSSTLSEQGENNINETEQSQQQQEKKKKKNKKNKKSKFNKNGQRPRTYGRMKFFDENKNYGFVVTEEDQNSCEVFVHYDDLQKAGVSKEMIKQSKESRQQIVLSFVVMKYYGKYNQSKKAVDIQRMEEMPKKIQSHQKNNNNRNSQISAFVQQQPSSNNTNGSSNLFLNMQQQHVNNYQQQYQQQNYQNNLLHPQQQMQQLQQQQQQQFQQLPVNFLQQQQTSIYSSQPVVPQQAQYQQQHQQQQQVNLLGGGMFQ